MIGGKTQFDPRIGQPTVLFQESEHPFEQRAIEDMHIQALQLRRLQEHLLQIPKPRAIEMQDSTARRQAGSLQPGFGDTIMPTGQLHAADAQRRTLPFDQLDSQPIAIFGQQALPHHWPARLDDACIQLKALAHPALLRAKK